MTPWGVMGDPLMRERFANDTLSLAAYCVGCDINADLVISGSITFGLGFSPAVRDGSISVSDSMGIALGCGVSAALDKRLPSTNGFSNKAFSVCLLAR